MLQSKKGVGIKIFLIMFVFFFSLTLVASKQVSFESTADGGLQFAPSVVGSFMEGADYTIHLHVINDTGTQTNATTACFVHLYAFNGGHIVEENMGWDSNGMEFKLFIAGGNQTIGLHTYVLQCENEGKQIHLARGGYLITTNGRELSLDNLILHIFLMLFFSGMMVGLYVVTKETDCDKWYQKVLKECEERNKIRATLSGLAYTIVKEKFILFYLLGFPVLMLFLELYTNYQLTFLSGLADAIISIYFVGLVIVGLIFFGKIQEFLVKIKDDIDDGNWGFNEGEK